MISSRLKGMLLFLESPDDFDGEAERGLLFLSELVVLSSKLGVVSLQLDNLLLEPLRRRRKGVHVETIGGGVEGGRKSRS